MVKTKYIISADHHNNIINIGTEENTAGALDCLYWAGGSYSRPHVDTAGS